MFRSSKIRGDSIAWLSKDEETHKTMSESLVNVTKYKSISEMCSIMESLKSYLNQTAYLNISTLQVPQTLYVSKLKGTTLTLSRWIMWIPKTQRFYFPQALQAVHKSVFDHGLLPKQGSVWRRIAAISGKHAKVNQQVPIKQNF